MGGENLGEPIIDYEKAGHRIRVYKVGGEVKVIKDGRSIAQTREALLLDEDGHKPVYYIPIKDTSGNILEPTSTSTTCPYKGIASYYNLNAGTEKVKDAVWQYLDSNEDFRAIRDYIAFYPNSIDQINVT